MGTGYLIDSNVIIDLSIGKLPGNVLSSLASIINTDPQISIVNKIELLSLKDVSTQIEIFTDNAYVIPLSDEIADATILVRKKHRIKLPDAVIAATAIVHKLTLITHNISDFKNIAGLKVMDSFLFNLTS
jgi:predicted nucleic acid-binding protein